MSSMACAGCGSPVVMPTDLTVQEASCSFCTVRTPLPADLLRVRLAEQEQLLVQEDKAEVKATAKKTLSFIMWIVIISTVLPIVIMAGVMIFGVVIANKVSHIPGTPHATQHGTHGHGQ